MQIRSSSLSSSHPSCPVDPRHPVHRHGHYHRHGGCDGPSALETIFRFLCVPCGRTISVLPDHLLPYRPISVPKVQAAFDAKSLGHQPPPASEKEKGCLKRAWERFSRRTTALAAILGQMMQLVLLEPKLIWSQLRRWGNLSDILLLLARPFNSSLLHSYRCLQPWLPAPG